MADLGQSGVCPHGVSLLIQCTACETSGPCGPNPEKPSRAVEERELSQPTSYGVGPGAPLSQSGVSWNRVLARLGWGWVLTGFALAFVLGVFIGVIIGRAI